MRMGADDQLALIPGGERFASDAVQAAVPDGESALIATSTHLYRLSPSRCGTISQRRAIRISRAAWRYSLIHEPSQQ